MNVRDRPLKKRRSWLMVFTGGVWHTWDDTFTRHKYIENRARYLREQGLMAKVKVFWSRRNELTVKEYGE